MSGARAPRPAGAADLAARRPAPLAPGRGLRPARARARATRLRAQPRPRRALRRRARGAGGARRRAAAARVLGRRRRGSLAACTWAALGGRSLAREADAVVADAASATTSAPRARPLPALVRPRPRRARRGRRSAAPRSSRSPRTPRDAVVGALLWGAVAGPAGVAAYRAANTLDAMVGHRSERYADFGWAAARLDDALTWPVARAGAALAAPCAPVAGGSPARPWRAAPARRRRPPEPERRPHGGRVRRRARRAPRRPAGLRGPGRGAPAARRRPRPGARRRPPRDPALARGGRGARRCADRSGGRDERRPARLRHPLRRRASRSSPPGSAAGCSARACASRRSRPRTWR